jgi:hypothetical protein
VSYWKQTRIISDTRLAARQGDISGYRFVAPASGGPISITAQLRFRRAFQAMMDAKGWNMPDIIMEEDESTVLTSASRRLYLPLIMK